MAGGQRETPYGGELRLSRKDKKLTAYFRITVRGVALRGWTEYLAQTSEKGRFWAIFENPLMALILANAWWRGSTRNRFWLSAEDFPWGHSIIFFRSSSQYPSFPQNPNQVMAEYSTQNTQKPLKWGRINKTSRKLAERQGDFSIGHLRMFYWVFRFPASNLARYSISS